MAYRWIVVAEPLEHPELLVVLRDCSTIYDRILKIIGRSMVSKIYNVAPQLLRYEAYLFFLPKAQDDLFTRLPGRVRGIRHGSDQDVVQDLSNDVSEGATYGAHC